MLKTWHVLILSIIVSIVTLIFTKEFVIWFVILWITSFAMFSYSLLNFNKNEKSQFYLIINIISTILIAAMLLILFTIY